MGKTRSSPGRSPGSIPERHSWISQPHPPPLSDDAVLVCAVALDVDPVRRNRLATLLADDETQRAGRFRFARDADRYVVARGTLRVLLAGYVGRPASALRFSYGARGKPSLDGGPQFNVAHAAGRALVAVTRAAPVGVDLEEVAPLADLDDVAATHFSPSEQRQFAALPAGERLAGFFRTWTRKEAYLKALGDGLAAPLARFSVSLHPDQPARLLSIDDDAASAARWTLEHLEPARGFVGALAVPAAVRVRCIAWTATE